MLEEIIFPSLLFWLFWACRLNQEEGVGFISTASPGTGGFLFEAIMNPSKKKASEAYRFSTWCHPADSERRFL